MNGRSIRINRMPVLVLAVIVICGIIYTLNILSEDKPLYGMLKNTNQVNMRKLLIGSIQAAQRGGLEILDVAHSRDLQQKSKGKTLEGVDDPYTQADARSHCVMKGGMHRIFPKLNIVSEEDMEGCSETSVFELDPTVLHESAVTPDELIDVKDITVWIDPLDATKEFTEKLYKYVTTMVCVAVKGVPIIGVIHSPFTGKTSWAWQEKSVSEDLANLKRENTLTKYPIITVSRSHAGDVKNLSKEVFGENSSVLIAAGSGYKVLQVVANNATAYMHSTRIKKWDICAGNAILNALGGKMTTLTNEVINYSDGNSPIDDKGLLAALTNHDVYISKILEKQNKGQR